MRRPENDQTMQAVILNYEKGMYLLKNYRRFQRERENRRLPPEDSLTVLRILAYSMAEHDAFTQRDQEVIRECGPLLVTGVEQLLKRMKEMPEAAARTSYCVLFEKYVRPDVGQPTDCQLMARLNSDGLSLTKEELVRFEMMGVSMFSSMAFQSVEQSAWLCSEKMLENLND